MAMAATLTFGGFCPPYSADSRALLSSRSVIFRPAPVRCAAITVEQQPSPLPALLSELARLEELESNWDGYQAMPVDPRVIRVAKAFLTSGFGPVPPHVLNRPELVPTAEGGLSLGWRRDDVEALLELPPDHEPFIYVENGQQWWEGPVDELPDWAMEEWVRASFA